MNVLMLGDGSFAETNIGVTMLPESDISPWRRNIIGTIDLCLCSMYTIPFLRLVWSCVHSFCSRALCKAPCCSIVLHAYVHWRCNPFGLPTLFNAAAIPRLLRLPPTDKLCNNRGYATNEVERTASHSESVQRANPAKRKRIFFYLLQFPMNKLATLRRPDAFPLFSVLCYFSCLSTIHVWNIAKERVGGWPDTVHKYFKTVDLVSNVKLSMIYWTPLQNTKQCLLDHVPFTSLYEPPALCEINMNIMPMNFINLQFKRAFSIYCNT